MRQNDGTAGRGSLRRAGTTAAGAVLLFLVAVRLLGSGLDAAAPLIREPLERYAGAAPSALGLGWLLTYLLTNGSVVAALGVTLGASGAVDPAGTLALVAGTRLGAPAFIVVIGGIDFLRTRRGALRSALGLGALTFVVSHLVYLPATAGAFAAYPRIGPLLAGWSSRLDLGFLQPGFAHRTAELLVEAVGVLVVIVASVAALYLSVVVFERALRPLDLEAVRERVDLDRPWLAFGVGALVTAVTSSVSFSIGVLVPVFNRGALERRELVPYVLGANVTTLLDTLVVALVLRSWSGAAAVLTLGAGSLLVAAAAVLGYSRLYPLLRRLLEGVARTRLAFGAFLLSLVVAPLLLIVLPW